MDPNMAFSYDKPEVHELIPSSKINALNGTVLKIRGHNFAFEKRTEITVRLGQTPIVGSGVGNPTTNSICAFPKLRNLGKGLGEIECTLTTGLLVGVQPYLFLRVANRTVKTYATEDGKVPCDGFVYEQGLLPGLPVLTSECKPGQHGEPWLRYGSPPARQSQPAEFSLLHIMLYINPYRSPRKHD